MIAGDPFCGIAGLQSSNVRTVFAEGELELWRYAISR
jgi:hypothetical protein